MADINLLPEEERSAENFELLRRKLLLGSIIVLVATGVLTLILLIYYSVLSASKSKLIGRIESSSQEIETLKPSEELIVVTKAKAVDANKILSARLDLRKFFADFASLVPQGIYFSDLKLTGGKLGASGRAKTSNDIAGFVSALVSSKGAELVSNVNVGALNSDEGGTYSFVIDMQVVTGGKKQ